jgi:predicted metalloprotease with PDZ domain
LYGNPSHSVSYYTKGQVLGVFLDILIRDRSDNSKSLDDLMRAMNHDFAAAGKTYRDSLDVQLIAEKLAGVSFEEFFKRYIAGADALPYRATFALAGLELREEQRTRPTVGFTTGPSSGGMTVRSVDADGPAAAAGLRVGDIITKFNGSEPPRRLNDWLRQQKADSTLHLRVHREEIDTNIDVRMGELTETFYDVAEDAHAGEKARHIREGLLHGTTDAAAVHASN